MMKTTGSDDFLFGFSTGPEALIGFSELCPCLSRILTTAQECCLAQLLIPNSMSEEPSKSLRAGGHNLFMHLVLKAHSHQYGFSVGGTVRHLHFPGHRVIP